MPTRAQPATRTNVNRHLVVCRADGRFTSTVDPADISEILPQKEQFVWLDLQAPQEADIALLRDEFKFHALAIEDATRHHERPKVDSYDGYYFLVFYAISYDERRNRLSSEAINRWQKDAEQFGQDAGALLYALLDTITDEYFPVIDRLADRVEGIEEQIFERFSEDALQDVFSLKRDLLSIRRIVAPERDVLNILIRREVPIFDRNAILYLQDVYDHIVRITDSIDTYRDLLSSALDAFLSVQSNRLNQIVKILTIASIVLMSDALVAGIYGMNFDYIPELHWVFGYPWALGLMVVISAGLMLFFRRRKWL